MCACAPSLRGGRGVAAMRVVMGADDARADVGLAVPRRRWVWSSSECTGRGCVASSCMPDNAGAFSSSSYSCSYPSTHHPSSPAKTFGRIAYVLAYMWTKMIWWDSKKGTVSLKSSGEKKNKTTYY